MNFAERQVSKSWKIMEIHRTGSFDQRGLFGPGQSRRRSTVGRHRWLQTLVGSHVQHSSWLSTSNALGSARICHWLDSIRFLSL